MPTEIYEYLAAAHPAMKDPTEHQQETLDPADWESMRALGHRIVDDAINYLRDVAKRPTWQRVPEAVSAQFNEALPRQASAPEEIYEQFLNRIFPYAMGNTHPRFWAWYMGNGTAFGALADFLAATMNSNVGAGSHVAMQVEAQVINWIKTLVNYPKTASGLLVGGASMANLIGLGVARNSKAGFDMRAQGLFGANQELVIYASSEVHSCHQKAVELLGLGCNNLRKVPVNDDYQLDLRALEILVRRDRDVGQRPICVIATAGTVNTGAIDPLAEIADFCAKEDLWFHVDGAIGGVAAGVEELKDRLAALSRADSLALDLHKWMHMPFEVGCALIKDRRLHRNTFAVNPEYLVRGTRGLASGSDWFSDYGLELSRGFRALKVWMSIKEHGLDRYERIMARNLAQARYLADAISRDNGLELMAPVSMNIVCFRYKVPGADEQVLDTLNGEILLRIQEEGTAAPSGTTLRGRYCLRVAIVNHRSQLADFDLLLGEVKRLGGLLASELNRKR